MRSKDPLWTAGPGLWACCLPVSHLTFTEQSSHASQVSFVPDRSLCSLPLRCVSRKHRSSKHSSFICLLIFKACVRSVDCFCVFIPMAAPGLDFVDHMTMWVGVITGLDGSREGRDLGSPAAQTHTHGIAGQSELPIGQGVPGRTYALSSLWK